jgi:very-short-patch-repair endonuclease
MLQRRQHGVVTRAQLLRLGMMPRSIEHRLANGRLHSLMRGVYAVGRPDVGRRGIWMAAVLACGPDALLSHQSAAALWGIRKSGAGTVHVVVPPGRPRRRPGIQVHRRAAHDAPGRHLVEGIPVTHPIATLVDLAASAPIGSVEAAVNEADHLRLVDLERLRAGIDGLPRRPGLGRLRKLLDQPTVALSSSELERLFLPLARSAGLAVPRTQVRLNGYRVDFYWPDLGLVVEADSLRYHRTPLDQAEDRRRENAHANSGLAVLRFTHGQVLHEPSYVRGELTRAAARAST